MLSLCFRSILVCVPLILCTALAAKAIEGPPPAGPAPRDIPKVKNIHVGKNISDWGDQGLKLTVFSSDTITIAPYSEFGVTARLGWDDDGFHAQFHVSVAKAAEAADINNIYDGDSVEVFLSPANDKRGPFQFDISPGVDPAHPEMRQKFFDYRAMDIKKKGAAAGTAFAAKTPDGYMVDVLVPWSVIQVKPKVGEVFGARVSVNHGEAGKARSRFYQIAPGTTYNFADLPQMRLADAAATAPQAPAVWGGYDADLKTAHIIVLADRARATGSVTLFQSGGARGTSVLDADGERSLARFSLPAAPIGQKDSDITVTLDGREIGMVQLPDIAAQRISLFQQGGGGRGWGGGPRWTTPKFESTVFDGAKFPAFAYDDPERIKSLVGPFDITTEFYDFDGNKVTEAAKPGRYGAVVKVAAQSGPSFTVYKTLFRRRDGMESAAGGDAVHLAAEFEAAEANRSAAAAIVPDPAKTDRDWWHALRKKLGTETKYEYFARTPGDYDTDPKKLWPVIFYLHGSGGGDAGSWDGVKDHDGPQGAAKKDPHFPFIVVSLRSPGGWHQPAVKDVMDEVAAKYRIDPDREYLAGFSMGGMGTWNVAYDQPYRFAGIVPVGGRKGDPAQMPLLKNVAVWIFNGADDTTTLPGDARAAADALKAVGADVHYTEIPKAGHVESHEVAFGGKDVYEWMLKHKRHVAK